MEIKFLSLVFVGISYVCCNLMLWALRSGPVFYIKRKMWCFLFNGDELKCREKCNYLVSIWTLFPKKVAARISTKGFDRYKAGQPYILRIYDTDFSRSDDGFPLEMRLEAGFFGLAMVHKSHNDVKKIQNVILSRGNVRKWGFNACYLASLIFLGYALYIIAT